MKVNVLVSLVINISVKKLPSWSKIIGWLFIVKVTSVVVLPSTFILLLKDTSPSFGAVITISGGLINFWYSRPRYATTIRARIDIPTAKVSLGDQVNFD